MSPIVSSSGGGAAGIGALIYDFTLSGAQAAIDTGVDGVTTAFSTAYKVLTIDVIHRTTAASVASGVTCTFNNVSSANYDWQRLSGVSATADAAKTNADSAFTLVSHGNLQQNFPAVHRIVIPGYAATDFQKIAHITGGYVDQDANCNVQVLTAGLRFTTAITRFKISAGGNNLMVGSRVTVTAV